jgi:hypothetical protein
MSFTRVIRSPLESTRMILALFILAAALGDAPSA